MNLIYNTEHISMSAAFEVGNTFEHLFGTLNLSINGLRLTENSSENLGYFYVDCVSFAQFLDENEMLENPLFDLEEKDLLDLYQEWKEYATELEESEKVQFFDRNYFISGSPFKSFFFDQWMIFYVLRENQVQFKFWNKFEPSTIQEVRVGIHEFRACLRCFVSGFEKEVKRLKSESNNTGKP